MTDNNPWAALDAATQDGNLYLEESAKNDVVSAFNTYNHSLQTLIDDALDDTAGYFGSAGNDLAALLEKAFNERGKTLTTYLKAQQTQATYFKQTAEDAAQALIDHDK